MIRHAIEKRGGGVRCDNLTLFPPETSAVKTKHFLPKPRRCCNSVTSFACNTATTPSMKSSPRVSSTCTHQHHECYKCDYHHCIAYRAKEFTKFLRHHGNQATKNLIDCTRSVAKSLRTVNAIHTVWRWGACNRPHSKVVAQTLLTPRRRYDPQGP